LVAAVALIPDTKVSTAFSANSLAASAISALLVSYLNPANT